MQRLADSPALRALDVLVGDWMVDIPNPPAGLDPVHGTTSFAWMKGGIVLVQHATMEMPLFPDAVAFFGADAETGRLVSHSWDSRGVVRELNVSYEDGVFRQWRDLVEGESFAQRLTMTLSDDGRTLAGPVEMARDGSTWQHDMDFVFQRA